MEAEASAGRETPSGSAGANQPRLQRPAGRPACEATGLLPGNRKPGLHRMSPPVAKEDPGGADWERDLIRAARVAGFLWRTEEAYRAWAARFARFLAPVSPYRATEKEVAAFLTELAVKQRASASTQKQALNALVFFMQEGLRVQLGPIDFKRAAPKRRMPVVLSREECARLFESLDGTARLMAKLAYGAGLRLMELLRLRVQDLDLARGRLMVRAGKGDRDRVTVLPAQLQAELQAHLERLRKLFAEDRAAGLAGVWLPEGLDRKYRGAGETWEWQWLFPSRETSLDPRTGTRRRHHLVGHHIPEYRQASGRRGENRQARDAARAAALVRHAFARERNGHPHGAGAARARERGNDANLYSRDAETGAWRALAAGWVRAFVRTSPWRLQSREILFHQKCVSVFVRFCASLWRSPQFGFGCGRSALRGRHI